MAFSDLISDLTCQHSLSPFPVFLPFMAFITTYICIIFCFLRYGLSLQARGPSAGLLFAHYSQRAPFLSFIVLIAVFTSMSFLFVPYTSTSILTGLLHSPRRSHSSAYYIGLYWPHPVQSPPTPLECRWDLWLASNR